ncbi:MAG: DUF480 domain-containing protein [Gammaproteobacteria bacterium]|nr:DUF480 domain-containing protein [Gammaproteobacteria bacterium]MDH3535116.1 DUF480 domain-containing protein [Gammaproteobacteria bacterium]
MLPLNLSANECRVIGCLMEKSITTPDQYPMTLNGLTNACNQKSARDPVMNLTPGVVQSTVRLLEGKHLVRIEDNFKRGVEKYIQRFCNTSYSELKFDPAQFAIVCLLLLRGAQTPGELRARSGRLHEFADNDAVVAALDALIAHEGDALVVKLPRTPGRKDSEYMHLFAGPVDIEAHARQAEASAASAPTARVNLAELEQRVAELEAQVAELRERLE